VNPIEITLPSGTFARIRPATFLDRLASIREGDAAAKVYAAAGDEREDVQLSMASIVSRIVLFDDRRLSIEEVLALDIRDADALVTAMGSFVHGPFR
jgi:hypothetical protein